MKCEVCSSEIPSGHSICPFCMINVSNNQNESISQNKFCTNCGNQLLPENKFCSSCGVTVGNVPEEINYMPATKKVKNAKSEIKSALFKTIIGAVGICVVIEIFLILTGDFSSLHLQVILSTLAIIIYGVVASLMVDLYERTEYKTLGLISLVATGIGFVHTSLVIWEVFDFENTELVSKILFSQWVIIIGLTHATRLLLVNLKNDLAEKSLWVTIPFLIVTYLMFLSLINFEIENEFYGRLVIVSFILTLFGTFATLILNKVNKD